MTKNVGWIKVDISEQNYIRAGQGTKTDYFSEKFQAAFDPPAPPPHFRKIMLQFFMMDMMEYMQGGTRAI